MANDVTTNPMVLDTPGATVLWQYKAKVLHFEWANYAAGNAVVVQGTDGKIKWSATAASDLSEQRSSKVGWINGVVLSTLTGGKCLVYVD